MRTQPRGGPVSHGTSGIPYLVIKEIWDIYHSSLFVEKVPRSPTLWGPAERENNLQYPLLPNNLVASVGVPWCNWRGP